MGVYNTMQSVGLFVGGATGGLLFQKYGFVGVFAFCSVLMLLWLVLAVISPAPKPVKNLSYPLNAEWQQNPDLLYQKLTEIEALKASALAQTNKPFISRPCKRIRPRGRRKIITGV